MTKGIRSITSVSLAAILAAVNCIPAYAAKGSMTADDIIDALHKEDLVNDRMCRDRIEFAFTSDRMPEIDVSGLPSKFDLRNVDGKNYVSPVKLQNPWGTCWSFGATAAAETSLAYKMGHDYNTETGSDMDNMFDLSEKHLAWFAYSALPEDCEEYPSQGGEGLYGIYNDKNCPDGISDSIYNVGGYTNYAATIYSAGMGPTVEALLPYEPTTDKKYTKQVVIHFEIDENGNLNTETIEISNYFGNKVTLDEIRKEWTDKGFDEIDYGTALDIYYKWLDGNQVIDGYTDTAVKQFALSETESEGDWTVDEDMRFMSLYTLKDGNILPTPAFVGENFGYVFNQAGVDAIKSEIYNGRAVSISYHSDQSEPGQVLDDNNTFMNFVDKNGKKTDDLLAEYWTHYTYDQNYDPSDENSINKVVVCNHTVCLVGYDDDFPKEYFNDPKGTIGGNGAFLAKNSWGTYKEDENGDIESWGNAGTGYFWISYYDQSIVLPESFDFDISENAYSRNIDMYDFLSTVYSNTLSFDSDIYMANVFTAQNNCTARYIGLETNEADIDVEFSVYLLNDGAEIPIDGICVANAKEHFDYAGYHVVDIGKTCYIPKETKYSVVVKAKADSKSELFYKEVVNAEYYLEKNPPFTAKGIVNPGESFVGTSLTDPDAWIDWSDIVTELKIMNTELNDNSFEYDNLPIRSYPETEALTIINVNVDMDKDTFAVGEQLEGEVVIVNNSKFVFTEDDELELVLSIGQTEEYPLAKISSLKPGESKSFVYHYIVKDKDAAAGEINSRVSVKMFGDYIDYGPLFDETLAYTVNAVTVSSAADGEADRNPATGNDLFSVVILAGASAAVAVASRKRR